MVRADRMWLKVLGTKLDDLTLMPEVHMIELPQVVFSITHVHHNIHAPQTRKNVIQNNFIRFILYFTI